MDRSATQLIELGRSLMAKQAWEEAHTVLTEALELDPDSEAFVLRGWCCSYLGELDEAIAACRLDRMLDVGRFTPLPSAVRRALSWVRENVSPTGGILVHSRHWRCCGYPEVTGYFVPTLLEYGEHHLATEFVEWLLQAQESDGSFRAPDDRIYVFDVAQVLRGFNACAKVLGKERIVDAVCRAADFMLSQALEGGSAGFCPQYKGRYGDIPESILLYAAGPLKEAGVLTGEAKYIDVAERCFSYYAAQPYAFAPATLTHYLGYELEAAIEWGRIDLVKPALDRLASEMTPSCAVRGKPGVEWVCPPGTAQLAVCWYKIGQWRYGDRAMAWLERHQRPSGGWPGSMGPDASYAADVEPPWAVKYYLDAHRLRVTEFMSHNADRVSPFEVPEYDGRWDAILNCVSSGPVLEVGCGRGRWLKLLKDLRPNASLAGVDPSRELLSAVPDGVERKVGSFEAIPYPDNTFEVVLAVDALAHCSSLECSLRELARVTRPGGVILIIDKDRRHQGRLVCPPWEEWIDTHELTHALSEVCDGFEEENISYAGRPADGLMVSWRARKRVTAGTPIRVPNEKPGISPQPLGWLEERTTEKRDWSVGRLSQNIGTYQLTAFGTVEPGSKLQRLDIGPYSATSQRSKVGEIKLSLRLPAGLFGESGLVPVHVRGVDLARVLVVPTGLGDLAIRFAKLGKYEAIMTLPLAKALVAHKLYREAVGLLECVIALRKDIGEAHYLLGVSLGVLGERVEDALTAYDKALALNFSEFWIRYHRGGLYLKLSEKEKARRDLNRAVELDPNHDGVRLLCKAVELKVWDGHQRPLQDQGHMRKFILIDHSIRDMVGHFYEYAAHVLEAARNARYRPVLATNRRFKRDGRAPWEVHRVYEYGFHFRAVELRWWRPLREIRAFIKRSLFRLSCALTFSRIGLVWVARNQLGDYLRRQPRLGRWLVLMPLMYVLRVLRTLSDLLKAAIPFPGYWRGLASPAYAFLRAVFYPVILVIHMPDWIQLRLYEFVRLKAFATCTKRLLREVALAEGDIVFIPTLSHVDLLGLLSYFRRERASTRCDWHLLFRQNIYQGRKADYIAQEGEVKIISQALRQFRHGARDQRVYFYTDTEELTDQYNRLGVAEFRTLPIPHTRPPRNRRPPMGPLRVVYVGDARSEKGYHLLPRIVQDLWVEYVRDGRVVFVVQSNFNIPEGEPEAVIARDQLEALPKDKVTLIKTPLSSEEYRDLLLSADINLLPYDRDSYYARSSGILAESLCAGVPVIVPSGTWMARQFIGELYRYQASLTDKMEVLKTRTMGQLRWRLHGNPGFDPVVQGEFVATNATKNFCWLAVPRGATHLIISLKFGAGSSEAQVYVDELDAKELSAHRHGPLLLEADKDDRRAVTVLPLDGDARKLWLGIWSAHVFPPVRISDIRIDFVRPRNEQGCPLGAVGLVYHSEDEITYLLREMINNCPHYQETARNLAQRWYERHNAARLIAELVGSSRTLAEPDLRIDAEISVAPSGSR